MGSIHRGELTSDNGHLGSGWGVCVASSRFAPDGRQNSMGPRPQVRLVSCPAVWFAPDLPFNLQGGGAAPSRKRLLDTLVATYHSGMTPPTRSSQRSASGELTTERSGLDVFLVGEDIASADAVLADVPALVKTAKRHDGFVWLRLVDPDEDMVNGARETLNIHPIAAADVVSGRQQPKVQKFAEHLFILLWSVLPDEDSDDLLLGQTYLYIGDGWLHTVQRAEGGELTDLPELLRKEPESFRNATMPAAYTIMADIVDGYAKAAADVESALEELEEQVFNDTTSEDHRRIYKLRKDIGRIDRAVSSIAAALRESTEHLEALTVGREHIVPYLHDLLDDAAGTAALINTRAAHSTRSSPVTRTTSPRGRTRTCAPSPRSPPCSRCPRSSLDCTA